MNLEKIIAVASGKTPADLLLLNARVINTFTGSVIRGNVAFAGERIAGIGDYKEGKVTIDLEGRYLAPSLIDGHTHIESSMLHPSIYAGVLIPRGISVVVTDLHEITNVCGLDGIRFVLDSMKNAPMDILPMVPSCVPATELETAGASIGIEEIRQMLSEYNVIGLGEMMNYPGIINSSPNVLNKISCFFERVIDGHAPGVHGKELNAYIAAGVTSDHESTAFAEGMEKLEKGMYLMIREGSSEKNLDALLPLVTDSTWHRCMFVVDDRNCFDLFNEGDVDAVLRKAIAQGLDPIRAIQMATINPAQYFRLYDRGAIAAGRLANCITFKDLQKLDVDMVFYRGELVVKDGTILTSLPEITSGLEQSIIMKKPNLPDLRLPARGKTYPVINIVPGQILTKKTEERIKIIDNFIVPDLERDILKLVVVERHKASRNIGIGLVHGFGLQKGALASSVAHDSHNIIAVGTNDADIVAAINLLEQTHGGLVACVDGQLLGSLPLPVAGLLSKEPVETVLHQFNELTQATQKLGVSVPDPFSILSFLALPVIPEIRLTDLGLVDVTEFRLMEI